MSTTRWSPSRYVENFKTPALVITGERDYRVPYTQSLGFFSALRKKGLPARLVVYPDAGHWPSWHEMAFYYNTHIDWFHQLSRWRAGDLGCPGARAESDLRRRRVSRPKSGNWLQMRARAIGPRVLSLWQQCRVDLDDQRGAVLDDHTIT